MTYRAVETLKNVDLILAEDTRQTAKLLKHYEIGTAMRSFNMNNEHRTLQSIISLMEEGQVLALCSDAGTPGISDPGFLLARECIRSEIPFEVLPGATAVTTALVSSGLPMDKFVFIGFLPHKKGKKTVLESLLEEERTTVCFESPHRIVKTLDMISEVLGNRFVVVARELTKKFEEIQRGTVTEVLSHFESHPPKGEFVLMIAGNGYTEEV